MRIQRSSVLVAIAAAGSLPAAVLPEPTGGGGRAGRGVHAALISLEQHSSTPGAMHINSVGGGGGARAPSASRDERDGVAASTSTDWPLSTFTAPSSPPVNQLASLQSASRPIAALHTD